MANYKWSICEPDQKEVVEKGSIQKENIMETFEQFPWIDRLLKMAAMKEDEICFSPSLGFKNVDNNSAVEFSIIGDEAENEFYIFYIRPKTIKRLFGLLQTDMEKYMSDITGQTKEDAIKFLKAFIGDDVDYMEAKMKVK